MGWNRRQQEKDRRKERQPLKGERDWTREQKEQIKDFLRRYGSGNGGEQRKVG